MPGHFLIAGAQRAGTTLLYRLLDQHPEIEMARPLRPEPKFFLRDGQHSLEEYERDLFSGVADAHLKGEKSTSYMERPDIAPKILATVPEVKIVFILRDPVERAISNYRFSVENGVETAPIEYAFLHERQRREAYDRRRYSVSPFAYLARGHYHRNLERWDTAIGRKRYFLMVFERMVQTPVALQELLRWLGVGAFEPTMPPEPINSSRGARELSPELRQVLADHFRHSNRLLRERFELDLSLWQP